MATEKSSNPPENKKVSSSFENEATQFQNLQNVSGAIGKSNPRALVRRLQTQPHSMQANEVIELQRIIGNKAVARLIQQKKPESISKTEIPKNPHNLSNSQIKKSTIPASKISPNPSEVSPTDVPSTDVQRLVSDQGQLYVPRGWAEQSVNLGQGEKPIKDILKNTNWKANLIRNFKNDNLDPDLYDISILNGGKDLFEKLGDKIPTKTGFEPKNVKNNRGALRHKISELFNSYTKLLKLDVPVQNPGMLQAHPILHVKDMIPEPDDLEADIDIVKVCGLISIYKAIGKDAIRSFLNGKINNLPANSAKDAKFYQAMHDYYYTDKGILYDEMSTHPQIFGEWGFSMIFSGDRKWANLYQNTPKLVPGKKYIFDVEGTVDKENLGHTMYVTMKKNFTAPMLEGEGLGDYFECHNDLDNWTKRHFECKVINIYSN